MYFDEIKELYFTKEQANTHMVALRVLLHRMKSRTVGIEKKIQWHISQDEIGQAMKHAEYKKRHEKNIRHIEAEIARMISVFGDTDGKD